MSLQGVDPLLSIDGRVMDPWQVLVPLTIRVGRESPNSQAEANTCSFGIIGDLPPQVRMNAPVEVYLAWGGGGVWDDVWDDLWSDTEVDGDPSERITRFVGRVTDLTPVSEGGLVQSEIVATGRMSDLGRVKSGWYEFPEETEDTRLLRLTLEAASADIDLGGEGYSWMMAKREVETASLLDILYDTATAGGLVYESVEGVTQFAHWQAREGAEPVAYLSPDDIEDSVAWSQQIDSFIARAIIRYGTPAEGNSEQPQVSVGERGWGKPEAVISTFLRDSADAKDFGTLVLARWGDRNAFEAPLLNLIGTVMASDTWDAVMGLAFGDVIVADGVTSTPAPLPEGTNEWFVEGWSEEYDKAGHLLTHRLALSVSDRSRFRPDLGEVVVIGDIVVTPAEAVYGTVRTVTATMTTATGKPVTSGVTVLKNGRTVLEKITTPGADGTLTFSLEGDALTFGSFILTIAYQGDYPKFLAASAQTPPVTVLEPDSTQPLASCSLVISPDVVNAGGTVKGTATIGMTKNGSKAGKVNFQISRDNYATWTTFKSVVTSKATETVSATWTSADGSKPAAMRAVFNPDLSGVANAISTPKDIDVRSKTTRTLGYTALWTYAYHGNGDPIGVGLMHQGYVSGYGNRKSLCAFTIDPEEWSGWTISKVEVWLDFSYWRNNKGTARIGSHTHAAMPPSDPVYNAARTTVTGWGEVGKWVNVTEWGKGLATGSLEGIVLGPGKDQTEVYRGTAYGVGASQPQLRVTGYKWE